MGRFLAKQGPGLHHVAYQVADIDATLAQLQPAGLALIDEQPRIGIRGSRVAFLHPRATGGVLTEIVEPARAAPEAQLMSLTAPRRISIGFQGGQVLALRVERRAAEGARQGARRRRLARAGSEEGPVRLDLAQVVYVRSESDEPRVGFGAVSGRSAVAAADEARAVTALRAGLDDAPALAAHPRPRRALERAVARFSRLGEHGGVWLAIGVAGQALDRRRGALAPGDARPSLVHVRAQHRRQAARPAPPPGAGGTAAADRHAHPAELPERARRAPPSRARSAYSRLGLPARRAVRAGGRPVAVAPVPRRALPLRRARGRAARQRSRCAGGRGEASRR